jgi:DNA-binding NtrC family response regulator
VQRLAGYAWTGNVRELRNFVERSLILGDFPVQGMSVPSLQPSVEINEHMTLEEVEKRHIQRVLAAVGGNKSEAARRLDVSRKTLERKCAEWGSEASTVTQQDVKAAFSPT